MAYAELAALRPRAGGEYVYLRAAFGRLAAFLTGWTSFVAGFSGAIAASAVVLAFYVGRFIPAANDATPLFVVPIPFVPLTFSRQSFVALAAIAAMAWIHLRGVGPGRLVMNVLAGLKVSALLIFIALGFTLGAGEASHLVAERRRGRRRAAWLLALIPVMFTYAGWNAAAYVAEEIHDPGRNVPRALALGTLAVVAIYFLLNLLFLYVLPVGGARPGEGQRARRHRRSAARRQRRQHHGDRVDRQHRCEHQRDDVRRPARLLRDGARRAVLQARRARSTRAITRRRRRSSRRRSGAACSCSPAAPTR